MITGYFIVITFLLMALVYLFIRREEKLQREVSSNDRTMRVALESIGDPVLLIDTETNIIWSNMAAERAFGELLGLKCADAFNCLEEPGFECTECQSFGHGKIVSHEKRIKVGSGVDQLFHISTAPVRDQDGEIRSVVKSFRNISQIMQLEEAAAQSELKYISLFENMVDGFAFHKVVTDENCAPVDYIFLEVNSAFEMLTGLRRDELIGKKVTEVLPGMEDSEFDWIGIYGKVGLTGEPIRFEQYFDILQRWYAVNCYCPRPGTFAVIFEDITEKKAQEQMVRAKLEESEIFIREIQHRVNNNLKSISQILNIQASHVSEDWDWTSKVLKDIQIRIMSMGLIHETLYGLDDLSRIPMAGYTGALMAMLQNELSRYNGPVNIHNEIPEDLTLNVETATLCGLIIAELVSNSMKHAFRPGEAGDIFISCRVGEDGRFFLEERDNGMGIPEHVSFEEPETVGIQLLNSYVEMIDGELTVFRNKSRDKDEDGETVITVSFVENEEEGSILY